MTKQVLRFISGPRVCAQPADAIENTLPAPVHHRVEARVWYSVDDQVDESVRQLLIRWGRAWSDLY